MDEPNAKTSGPGEDTRRLGVLLTEGSSSSSRQAIYALADRYRIGVLDPNRLCQSRFSRHVTFHRCPHFADQPIQYLRFVLDTMRQCDYDVLFPTHDQVYLLSRFESLLSQHVRIPLPEFESLHRLQSKVAFHELLCQLDLPGPETVVIRWPDQPPDPPSYPCYLKADHGTAGEGVRLVEHPSQFESALEDLERMGLVGDGSRYMIQTPCQGTHSVVQCVFGRGELLACHCAETQQRGVGGGQGLRTGVEHPSVVDHMRLLGRHLNWHGPLFLEYFYDADRQRPAYIEANPRIGETVNATLSGVNLCHLTVTLALSESNVQPLPGGAVGMRSHVDFLLLIAEAMRGAGRRQLARQLIEMMRHTGSFQGAQGEMTRLRDDWLSLLPAAFASARVLLRPSSANRLVAGTTRSCALTDSAAAAIDSLSFDDVRAALLC